MSWNHIAHSTKILKRITVKNLIKLYLPFRERICKDNILYLIKFCRDLNLNLYTFKKSFDHDLHFSIEQFTVRDFPNQKDAIQILGDVYTEEPFASLLGVFISAKRLSEDVQQIVMYGNKVKASYEEFLDPRHRFHSTKYAAEDEVDFQTARKLNESIFNGRVLTETRDETGRETTETKSETKEHKEETEVVQPEVQSAGFIFNYSIFYAMSSRLLLGLEIMVFYDVTDHHSYLAFYPQIHAQLTKELEVQVGPGLVFTKTKIIPEFVHRVIIETLPSTHPNLVW